MDMRKQLKVQTVTQAQDETGEAGDVRAGDVRHLLHHCTNMPPFYSFGDILSLLL